MCRLVRKNAFWGGEKPWKKIEQPQHKNCQDHEITQQAMGLSRSAPLLRPFNLREDEDGVPAQGLNKCSYLELI
jgi:hypothetical protein